MPPSIVAADIDQVLQSFASTLPIVAPGTARLPQLSASALTALWLILAALRDQQAEGAQIRRVELEPFVDVDAADPLQVLVVAFVHATPEQGNSLWERTLAHIEAEADREAPDALATLDREVGLSMRWRADCQLEIAVGGDLAQQAVDDARYCLRQFGTLFPQQPVFV